MLENLYTTKMSANKKNLQNRFTKIRSKNARISKTLSITITALIAVAMLYSTAVMAAIDKQSENNAAADTETKKNDILHIPQKIIESEPYMHNTNAISLNVETDKSNFESENTDILHGNSINEQSSPALPPKNNTAKAAIKSQLKSDEPYIGFEQIVLPNINTDIIQKELQTDGITRSQNSYADLKQSYIVNDLTADTTQVKADKNGNISVYISTDTDNLFDINITDSAENKNTDSFTVLANSENAYSFLGLEPNKTYNVKILSRTQGDWDINGNYIIY